MLAAVSYTHLDDVAGLLERHLKGVLGPEINFAVPIMGDYRRALLAHLGEASVIGGIGAGVYFRFLPYTAGALSSGGTIISGIVPVECLALVDTAGRTGYAAAVLQMMRLTDRLRYEVFYPGNAEQITSGYERMIQKAEYAGSDQEYEPVGAILVYGVRHNLLLMR